jgi:hypothetical protein
MIFAAFWYIEGQNSPSDPFVLELDVTNGVEEALLAYVKQRAGGDEDESSPCEPTMFGGFGEFTIEYNGRYFVASSQGWDSAKRK